ncbi:MFS transporter [Pseudomonas sp. SA3-5]|uniref:MFS transporter n=1 Tax=Pseudomonas aestuarii TaxID=3018340 RepID=A0ABT4XLV9_9PSED|nr:MFS transporter [Pseudomonas aestuarii]MDA7089214.1 MFS transporter [Pseudomonas aestuarii]
MPRVSFGPTASWPQASLLLFGSCLSVLAAVLVAPLLPAMQAHFADTPGSTVLVPLVIALPALMVGLLAPFAGIIADRMARKPLLLISLVLYSLFGLMPLWLDSLYLIVASRAGIGLAEAGIMTCCTTLIGDYYNGVRRQRLLALQMVATSLSAVVFITLSGFLGGDSWRMPFALYAVGLVLLPLMAWLLWEPDRGAHAERVAEVRAFPWKALLPLYTLTLLAGISLLMVPSQAGYLLGQLGVEAPQLIGMTMGANQLAVVAGALSFRVLARHRLDWLLLAAFALTGAGALLMAVASTHEAVIIAVVVNGLGLGLMLPTLITWIMAQVGVHLRGRATGGFNSAMFSGQFLSPLVILAVTGGVLTSLPAAIAVVGCVQLLIALACLGVPKLGGLQARAGASGAAH